VGGLIVTHQCNKGHTALKRSTTLFKGLVTLFCPECPAYFIEGGSESQWVHGSIQDPAVQAWLLDFADRAIEERLRLAEMMNSPIDDPRWEQMSSW
jgi:hypothetical protein